MHPDYAQTLAYLYANVPMFQRVGAVAYKKDLHNTHALLAALDHPEQKFRSVHVAGTNGKGSSSHMLAAILQEAGYRTGLYTSPHLKEFTERIRINGQEVDQDFVVDFVARIRPTIDRIQPSFFEVTVAMAFDYFARQHVDIAVIEVGLGGRLDATNVITPLVSLITNIGYDHMDLLGNTLPEIAGEKAGIIKTGVPIIVSERQSEVEQVFLQKAAAVSAPIAFASDRYHFNEESDGQALEVRRDGEVLIPHLQPELAGYYQRKNMAGVLAVVAKLQTLGFDITRAHIAAGIGHAATITGLKGRWQTISQQPLTIADTGHNAEGIAEVLVQIARTPHRQLHWVFGVVKDKALDKVLELLPRTAHYYFCQASIPRALDAEALADTAATQGLQGVVIRDVNAALRQARLLAGPDDLVVVGGSNFVVADIEGL